MMQVKKGKVSMGDEVSKQNAEINGRSLLV